MDISIIGCTLSTRRFIGEILRQKGCRIVGVFTIEDAKADTKSRHVLLDSLCKSQGIPLHKLDKVSSPAAIKLIKESNPDIILESGWSQLIPKEILSTPRLGCIGIHCSYLPQNQGAASLNWALIKGEKSWGVSLFYLTEKVDEGDIIDQRTFTIDDRDTVNTLFDKADDLSVEMLRKNLPLLKAGNAPRKKQEKAKATYLPRRKPEDGKIEWSSSARQIFDLIRALTCPYPGAFTFHNKRKLIIQKASLLTGAMPSAEPGTVLKILPRQGIVVASYQGAILLERVLREDGIGMWADDFAQESKMKIGDSFEK